MDVIGVHPSFAPAIRHRSGHRDEEDAMRMGRGFLWGALGCLAIGISGGEAVAENPEPSRYCRTADAPGATKNQGIADPRSRNAARTGCGRDTCLRTRDSLWAAATGGEVYPFHRQPSVQGAWCRS